MTRYFGRRTVYVWGMAAMATELCLIGILNVWTDHPTVAWVQAVLTLVWTFTFQLSAGQLGWALPAEIGSTRLRQKTVCLARNVSNITGVIGGSKCSHSLEPSIPFRHSSFPFRCVCLFLRPERWFWEFADVETQEHAVKLAHA
jgi:Sugar (and other) transporter